MHRSQGFCKAKTVGYESRGAEASRDAAHVDRENDD